MIIRSFLHFIGRFDFAGIDYLDVTLKETQISGRLPYLLSKSYHLSHMIRDIHSKINK